MVQKVENAYFSHVPAGFYMKKWILIALLPFLLLACKSKKKPPSDEDGITTADFIELFTPIKAPYTITDDSLDKKKTDTVSISYKTFTGIVPDSLLSKQFGKNSKPRFYPMGKMSEKNQETYLVVKAISPAQKAAYALVFDKDKKFMTGLPLLVQDNNNSASHSAAMDNKFSITTNMQHKLADGRLLYKKAVYAYISSAAAFALILTETNETGVQKEILNPIDTFQAKNKLAGDYRQNRLNLVSVRDSKKPGELLFFVHFEKEDCKGELKGLAKITSPGKATYHQAGDQCVLEFAFKGNTVSLKEDGCGSHRDIKCFFEGNFVRKPPAKSGTKPAKAVPKKKGV